MDISKYRKYVVKTDLFSDPNPPWNRIFKHVSASLYLHHNSWRFNNHPLVDQKIAYWSNDRTLCLGYQLQKNVNIYRPIFNLSRQKALDKVHVKLPQVVLDREKKRLFLECLKIKILPVEIVNKILKIAYET